MPREVSYLQNPGVLWLNVISDGLIAISCFAILFLLFRFARQRRDLQFRWVSFAFGMFILACGATHLLAVWIVWHPDYWLDGAVKAVAAVSSVIAAALLVPLLPGLAKLPGRSDLTCLNNSVGLEIADRKKAEEALRKANTALETSAGERAAEVHFLADTMPQIVWTARPDGTVTYFNRRWYEYCGCTPESLNWQEQTHPDDLPGALRLWKQAIESGGALEMETRIRSQEGRYAWHLTRALARLDPGGRVVQWVGTTTAMDRRPRAEVLRAEVPGPALSGNETVLVVENAATVLRLIRNVLSEQGYRILEASSPDEAQRIFEERGTEIDLLLTEAAMHTTQQPGLKVLVMAGHSDSDTLPQGTAEPGTAIIQKPFTAAALARKVREVLAGPPR